MKKITQFLFLFCLAMLGAMPTYANDKHSHQECHPLVGAWTFNFELAGNLINGVIMFHSDGTLIFQDSSDLTQSTPPLASQGDFFTFSAGIWKKVKNHHYCGVSTCVVLARDTQCTPSTFPGCLALPAVPLTRIKNFIKDIVINKTGQATATIIVTFHPADDLTLKEPLINPSTGQPFPSLTGQVVMQKLTFK